MTEISASASSIQSFQQPPQRLPERPPLQQSFEVAEASQVDNEPAAAPQPASETSNAGDDGSEESVDLNQLVARGQAQENDAPRTQQQIDGQRQQLQDAVAAAETPAPEPEIDAQA